MDGWWLCSFRGRQGIVPANRVTLLAGMYYESALRFSTSPESSISDVSKLVYCVCVGIITTKIRLHTGISNFLRLIQWSETKVNFAVLCDKLCNLIEVNMGLKCH